MNLILDPSVFDYDYLCFQSKIKNKIIENSSFIKIYYSTPLFCLNCISLKLSFNNVNIIKNTNKYILYFKEHENRLIMDNLILMEQYILSIINIQNKTPVYTLNKQLSFEKIKLYSSSILKSKYKTLNVHLKISGIWETSYQYGLTFKFLNIDDI